MAAICRLNPANTFRLRFPPQSSVARKIFARFSTRVSTGVAFSGCTEFADPAKERCGLCLARVFLVDSLVLRSSGAGALGESFECQKRL